MANRATRRKKSTKTNRQVIEPIESDGIEKATNACKVIIAVSLTLLIFYGITIAITDVLKSNKDEENIPAVIQYDEILATQTFKMHYNEYYVVFYDFEDYSATIYDNLIIAFQNDNPNMKVYTVDLSKGINKQYMAEASNLNTSDIDSLKINEPTVIKIKNGNNIAYGEGIEAVQNVLK